MVAAVGVEPTTSAAQIPTIQVAEFRFHSIPLTITIIVPVKRLSVLQCIYRLLASILVEIKCGSQGILGHSLRNKIPCVGNKGEKEAGGRYSFEWI